MKFTFGSGVLKLMTGMPAARASLTTSTRLPGSGLVVTMPSALAAIAERIASCCDGDVAVVERGLDGLAGVLRPLVGAGEEIGPHRVGRRAVRNPVEGLGLGGQRQREHKKREA